MNDKRIRVSKETVLAQSLLATGAPLRDVPLAHRYLPTFTALFGKCAGVRRTALLL